MLLSNLSEPAATRKSVAHASRFISCASLLLGTLATSAFADLPDKVSDAGSDRSGEAYCARALDAQANRLRAGRAGSVGQDLDALLAECSELPQIRHNLAVVAARAGDWETAIDELEASIALDERAADSVDALREIHRWRAKAAYAEALGERRAPRRGPVPDAQDSGLRNSDARRALAQDARLRNDEALDYELWNWWSTAADERHAEHRAHYATGFGGRTLLQSGPAAMRPDWDEVTREIGFTAEDAVAVVRWTVEGEDAGRLLLMRLAADRWTIYEERAL